MPSPWIFAGIVGLNLTSWACNSPKSSQTKQATRETDKSSPEERKDKKLREYLLCQRQLDHTMKAELSEYGQELDLHHKASSGTSSRQKRYQLRRSLQREALNDANLECDQIIRRNAEADPKLIDIAPVMQAMVDATQDYATITYALDLSRQANTGDDDERIEQLRSKALESQAKWKESSRLLDELLEREKSQNDPLLLEILLKGNTLTRYHVNRLMIEARPFINCIKQNTQVSVCEILGDAILTSYNEFYQAQQKPIAEEESPIFWMNTFSKDAERFINSILRINNSETSVQSSKDRKRELLNNYEALLRSFDQLRFEFP